MPEPDGRDLFLSEVAARLDLPEPVARDALEELAGHLDDAAAALRAAGYAPGDAGRCAIQGLGDPRELADALGRARHARRQLLAAAGGGARAVLVEGIRTYLFMLFAFGTAAILAMPIAAVVLHAMGTSTSSYFGGPLGSAVTVVAVAAGMAYLGWILPARIAVPAVRSVRGVRRWVAALGLVAGSTLVWLLVPLAMDPVLAVGLPFAPVALAAAALRAPERPTVRVGLWPALVLAVALVVPLTLVALATTTPSGHEGWEANTSVIGEAPVASDAGSASFGASWSQGGTDWMSVTIDSADVAPAISTRYPVLQVEVWPAANVDGRIVFGTAPLVAVRALTQTSTTIQWQVPRLRDRMTIATFVIGIGPDGRRAVLADDFSLDLTPPWTGTVAAWWFGG